MGLFVFMCYNTARLCVKNEMAFLEGRLFSQLDLLHIFLNSSDG